MQSFQVCVQIIKLSGHIKAQAFLFFKPGLIGSGLGLMIFHKMTPRTHRNYWNKITAIYKGRQGFEVGTTTSKSSKW